MSAERTIVLRAGERTALDPSDRGLAYGDGLFETLLVHRGETVWWEAHWVRLQRGAAALRIPLPDETALRREARTLIGGAERGVLKLILTRGPGGRGYATPHDARPTIVLSLHPAPPAPRDALKLRWCRTRLAIQPALAGLKHCNRLEQVLARAEWDDESIHEGLMCDSEGFVVGATAANLFARIDGRWLTPPVDRCGIAGVCRGWLLRSLDRAEEHRLHVDDVEAAETLFLCNAVRGILAVASLGARRWAPSGAVGTVAAALTAAEPGFAVVHDDGEPPGM